MLMACKRSARNGALNGVILSFFHQVLEAFSSWIRLRHGYAFPFIYILGHAYVWLSNLVIDLK
jgi:hypothetical protein